MDIYNLVVNDEERIFTIGAPAGKSVLEILRDNQIYMPAPCGGSGTCGKCKIKTVSGSFGVSDAERLIFSEEELGSGYRLACMCVVVEDSEIVIGNEKNFEILTTYGNGPSDGRADGEGVDNGFELHTVYPDVQRSITDFIEDRFPGRTMDSVLLKRLAGIFFESGGDLKKSPLSVLTDQGRILDIFEQDPPAPLGIALDIGTTTICFEIVELLTGRMIGGHAMINRQREFGADVIARIQSAGQGKLPQLNALVVEDILSGINELCLLYNVETEHIHRIVISGNTTMLHLLMGIPCESLGRFPFTPVMTCIGRFPFHEVFGSDICGCEVTVLPSISSYVGADISAGIVFCGGRSSQEISLLIDLGTNGEMAIFSRDRILCTSTAAGPAFEGGNISCGTGSIPGAISTAQFEDGVLHYNTIGGAQPVGICGSGVVDIVASLVKAEIIEDTGLMDEDYFEDGFPVAPEAGITFTQQDVRELQLGKSAVRAGVEVLIAEAGVSYDEIGNVYLAGGFGHKLNLDSAEAVGLIPAQLKSKVTSVGNSSLGGCVEVLRRREAEDEIVSIARGAREINLSSDKRFNDLFMEYMYFAE